MSNLTRLPHEISLWDDILTAVDSDGKEYDGFIDIDEFGESKTIIAQYYKEKKICAISSDKLNSPIYAIEPNLTRKTDGTSTLTFSIYGKYLDEETNELRDNPFIQYLTNERKVKLKYYPGGKLKWLDFVIKKIDESSENYKFTYTATDLFINELSKSGYGLEFDMELENNQGSVTELAEKVLDGSDWSVGADSELLQQTTTEVLYKIKLTKEVTAHDIFDEGNNTPIAEGEIIYAFYSSVINESYDYFQFIYSQGNKYQQDENGVVYGCGNYYIEFNKNDKPFDEYEYFNEFRGERYVRSPKVVYEDVLGKYVNVYNNDEVRGYTESRYISPALVTNLITNGSHIIKDTGWNKRDPESLSAKMIPSFEDNNGYNVSREFMLEVVPKSADDFVVNSGFVDNAGKIGKIAKEDAFVFRIKGGFRGENDDLSLGRDQYFKIEVASYEFDEDGTIVRLNEAPILSGRTNAMDDQEYYYASSLLPTRAVSNKELLDFTQKRFGIFISVPNNTKTYYIKEVELFLCLRDTSGNIMLPDGKLLNDSSHKVVDALVGSYVETTYHYYNTNPLAKDASELTYIYSGKQDLSNYRPDYVAQFEKIRGVTAKETNRFNLLQSLSETFECWCRFDVWHKKTGEIALGKDVAQTYYNAGSPSYNPELEIVGGGPLSKEELAIVANGIQTAEDNYKQQKFVSFHKTIGQKKNIGFVYGINLKSIARTLESNDIATKLIVKNNNNKYANSGSCNIARAVNNPSGQNFVLDFSHYIRQGLLNYGNVQNDLYSTTSNRGWIGLFYNLKNLSKERDELITKQSSLIVEQTRSRSEAGSSATLLTATENERREQIEYFEKLTGYKYGDLGAEETRKEIEEQGWLKDAEVNATLTNIEHLKLEIEKYESVKGTAETADENVQTELDKIQNRLNEISNETSNLLTAFEKKYGRFLQEASWISEDYTDDNLYYFDAETTLHNAAQPKVSYSINIVELSQIEGYENYSFDLGDISYVQDPEFFGWEYVDKVKTPVKEEVVITETVTNFNSPEKNTIKAKNYRDSFEDLFQRMAASSQQLQFHSGAYDRAADAVNTDGSIMPQALSDAFAHNAYVLSNVANQSVKWDEYGITTTDTTNPAEIVRVTSGGIYLTEDGGRNWTTGISANGINAKTVTAGQLNTGAITIMNKDQTAFRWDSKGINAFKEEEKDGKRKRVNGTYVRFDEYGVYGIDGQVDFDPKEKGANEKTGIDKINDEAKFALTWDGFVLNSSDSNDKTDNTSTVRISDKEDFQILNKDGEERLKIGRLEGYNSVGMKIQTLNSGNEVVIGDTGFEDTSGEDHGRLVFKAGPSPKTDDDGNKIDDSAFRVYEDGYFYAKNGQVGGALTPAQLRDIKIETSYLNKVGGSVMCLSCYPTIVQDEINSVKWWIGEIEYLEPELEIDYERALEMLESVNGAINDEGEVTVSSLQMTAIAEVSKFEFAGEEEDTPEEIARSFEISLGNIFKTVTEYVNSESATDIPEVGWSTEVPEMVPGLYVWTRFTNVYVVPREGDGDARYEVSYYAKDGSGQFTSIVFKRTENRDTPNTPKGGTYADPIPEDEGWADGIPSEGGPFVWSSQAVFKPGQDGAEWSTPVLMRDVSGKFDVQYSNETEQPPNPTEASEKWYDATLTSEDLTEAIWMATRSSDDDGQTWTSWVITRIKGEKGDSGRGVAQVVEYYAAHNSSASPPTAGWTNSIPTLDEENKYLWNYEQIYYTDETSSETEPAVIGVFGKDGRGIKEIINYYLATAESSGVTINTSGWTTEIQNVSASEKYLWNYEQTKYTEGTDTITDPCIIGAYGDPGPKGDKGDTGTGINVKASESDCQKIGDTYLNEDGELMILTSISPREFTNGGKIKGPTGDSAYLHIAYANSADGSADFSTSDYNNKIYIGHYTDTTEQDSQNYQDYKWTKWKGDGGEAGRGIREVVEYYAAHTSNTTAPSSGWSSSPPTLDATNKYLWNYEEIFYTDDTSATTDPIVIGVFGKDGRGISSITEYYGRSTKKADIPTSWSTVVPELTSYYRYLWNYEVIEYTDGSDFTSTKAIIGVYGDPGSPGTPGDPGTPGAKTEAIRIYYRTGSTQVTKPNQYTNISSSSNDNNVWTTSSMTPISGSPYVYTCTGTKTTTYSSSTDTTGIPKYNNDWTEPELYLAYNNVSIPYENYAEYLKITNFGASGLHYNGGQLYINADHIKVTSDGNGSTGDVVFEAAGSSKTVFIAGWTANSTGLAYGTLGSSNSMCLYPQGKTYTGAIANGTNKSWVIGVGTTFGVTTNGDLYCSTANLGNFRVTSNSLTFDTKEQEMVGASIPEIRLFYEAKNIESGSATLSSQGFNMLTYDISDKYVPQVALYPYRLSFIRNTGTLDSPTYSRSINLEPVWGTNQANDKLYIGNFAYFGADGTVYLGKSNDTYNLRVFKSAINFYYKNTNGSYVNAGMLSTTNATINNQSVYVVKGDGKFYLQGASSTSNAYLYVGNYGQIINSSGSPVATSDERAKRDIQNLTEKYEQLYDAIIPRLYRFKDGTSGRLHSGYIVQEVLSAMEKASIPTSDFAAVCAIDGPENEENLWGLRYEEFISLNTWQIQKLKSRTVIAEREIEQLKLQVQSLTEKLENLKTS